MGSIVIDIHTHILPHMDDGAVDENISIEMLELLLTGLPE